MQNMSEETVKKISERHETCDLSWEETREKPEGSGNIKFQICCTLEKPLPQQLTLSTASRSLRPDMVLGAFREQYQSPEMQGAKAGRAIRNSDSTCSTPQCCIRLLCNELN